MNLETQTAGTLVSGQSYAARALGRVLAGLLEIDPKLPTRCDSVHATGKKLDMIFTSTPPHICPLNCWEIKTPYCPRELYRSGLSDHTPVVATITKRGDKANESLPVPQEIFQCERYNTFLEQICWEE